MAAASRSVAAPRRDRRRLGVLVTLLAVLVGGVLLDRAAQPDAVADATASAAASTAPAASTQTQQDLSSLQRLPHGAEVRRRFDEAVVMLHARQYEHAATALHRVLTYAPRMPEAHVNMGFALLGLNRPKEARDFFEGASALAPMQANAYYGLALSFEAQGDLAAATGAMRSYLHLARDERPEHLARARAALWEWEQQRPAAARSPSSRIREPIPARGKKSEPRE